MISCSASMTSAKGNVAVLAMAPALLLEDNSTDIAVNGVAGYALGSNKALATLPVTGWVIGAAIATFPASMLMKRIGLLQVMHAGAALVFGLGWLTARRRSRVGALR